MSRTRTVPGHALKMHEADCSGIAFELTHLRGVVGGIRSTQEGMEQDQGLIQVPNKYSPLLLHAGGLR